jgi:hypothetical protein
MLHGVERSMGGSSRRDSSAGTAGAGGWLPLRAGFEIALLKPGSNILQEGRPV